MMHCKTSLGLKAGLIFLLLAIAFNIGSVVALQWMIFPAFTDLEQGAARQRLERAQGLLESELKSLADIGHEYSQKTRTWYFLLGQAPDYVEQHLRTDHWNEIDVELMVLFDANGNLIWGKVFDPYTGQRIHRQDIRPETLNNVRNVALSQPLGDGYSGIITLPLGKVMVVVQPVVKNSGTGPVAGYFVIGRFLTEERRRAYSERINVDFYLSKDPGTRYSPGASHHLTTGSNGVISTTVGPDGEHLVSTMPMIDLFGNSLLLEATTPRHITHSGQKMKDMALAFLALISLLFILMSWAMLRYLVIAPVNKLRGHMAKVRKTGDLSRPLHLNTGDEIGALAREFDITTGKLQRAYEELEHARDMAVSSERKKSEFLASMNHEIRTPMNGVIGMTELLLRTDLSDNQLRLVDTVKASASSLLAMINDILDFSGIVTGRVVIDHTPFSLDALIENVNAAVSEPAQSKGLTYTCHTDAYLPTGLIGDELRIQQVLVNLLGNAIKFTDEGEISLTVSRQHTWWDGGTGHCILKFTVTDTGIGISDEVESKIFSAFSKADNSATREFDGTGLGLSISKLLVDLMGGDMGFNSPPGQGTTFWFTVPARLDRAFAGEACPPQIPEGVKPDVRIMVVDDQAASRERLLSQLRSWGATPEYCTSIPEGLVALSTSARAGVYMDLVLVAHHRQGMSGLKFAEEVAKNEELGHPAIIVLSSDVTGNSAGETSTNGVNAYLSRSVSASELFTQVCRALPAGALQFTQPAQDTEQTVSASIRIDGDVLVVEDNPVNRELIVHQMRDFGCEVATVENGESAVAALEQNQFDLVIMDCQMPVMDGFEATRIIRERGIMARTGGALPVLAVTANTRQIDRERCLDAGMDAFLAKPFTSLELGEAIHDLLQESLAPGILDETVLDRLRVLERDGSPDLLARLTDLYISSSRELVLGLSESIANRDARAIEMSAHTLKSSSANLGALQFSELCAQMEHMGREDKLAGIEELFEELQREFPLVCAALEHSCKNL